MSDKEYSIGTFWGLAFGGWLASWVAMEICFSIVPDMWWVYSYVCVFLPLELTGAALHSKLGDTFSQLMWWFGEAGWARGFLTCGIFAGVTARAYTIAYLVFTDYANWFLEYGPLTLLFAGVMGWLMVHGWNLGKDG